MACLSWFNLPNNSFSKVVWSNSLSFTSCGFTCRQTTVWSLRIHRLDYRALYFLNGLDDWLLCRTGGLVADSQWDQITIKREQKRRWNQQGGSLNSPVQVSSDLIRPCRVQPERRRIDMSVGTVGVAVWNLVVGWQDFVLEFVWYQGHSDARSPHVI